MRSQWGEKRVNADFFFPVSQMTTHGVLDIKFQSIEGITALGFECHEDFPTPFGSKQCCNKSVYIVLFWKVLICSFLKRVLSGKRFW